MSWYGGCGQYRRFVLARSLQFLFLSLGHIPECHTVNLGPYSMKSAFDECTMPSHGMKIYSGG